MSGKDVIVPLLSFGSLFIDIILGNNFRSLSLVIVS